jgi:uncharacterized protein (DUF2236 family)
MARLDFGLFGPESMIWRVSRESVVTLAGACAILMQFAHPKVAAGVRDHSSFETDPVGRLRRTLDLTLALVFGRADSAMQAVRIINSRHRAVTGPGYAATDPELLMWVQATLLYSGLRAYREFVGPLTDADRDLYYQDNKRVGVLLGIPADLYPRDVEGFDAYLAQMINGGEIVVGEDARQMAEVILRPRFPGVPGLAFAPLTTITAGLLPPKLRKAYGLKWGRVQRAAFGACRLGLPRLVAIAPRQIRLLAPARRAYQRVEAA